MRKTLVSVMVVVEVLVMVVGGRVIVMVDIGGGVPSHSTLRLDAPSVR